MKIYIFFSIWEPFAGLEGESVIATYRHGKWYLSYHYVFCVARLRAHAIPHPVYPHFGLQLVHKKHHRTPPLLYLWHSVQGDRWDTTKWVLWVYSVFWADIITVQCRMGCHLTSDIPDATPVLACRHQQTDHTKSFWCPGPVPTSPVPVFFLVLSGPRTGPYSSISLYHIALPYHTTLALSQYRDWCRVNWACGVTEHEYLHSFITSTLFYNRGHTSTSSSLTTAGWSLSAAGSSPRTTG